MAWPDAGRTDGDSDRFGGKKRALAAGVGNVLPRWSRRPRPYSSSFKADNGNLLPSTEQLQIRSAAGPMKPPREGGFLISRIHQLSGRILARKLKQYEVDEINPAQGRILFALWREDNISIQEL